MYFIQFQFSVFGSLFLSSSCLTSYFCTVLISICAPTYFVEPFPFPVVPRSKTKRGISPWRTQFVLRGLFHRCLVTSHLIAPHCFKTISAWRAPFSPLRDNVEILYVTTVHSLALASSLFTCFAPCSNTLLVFSSVLVSVRVISFRPDFFHVSKYVLCILISRRGYSRPRPRRPLTPVCRILLTGVSSPSAFSP